MIQASRFSSPFRRFLIVAVAATTMFSAPVAAQAVAQAGATAATKRVLGIDDYAKWRSINGASVSADGKWVTYDLAFMNTAATETHPVLHLLRLSDDQDSQVANASGGAFSPDGKWLAYLIDPSGGGRGGRGGRGAAGGQGGRGQTAAPPPPRRVELRNLATGAVQSWQDIQSFTFSASSSHLVLRRRAPGAANANAGRGGAGGAAPGGAANGPNGAAAEGAGGPRGADVILHDLASGHDQLLGSVGEISFNKKGDLLAYTVDAAPRDGNGLFVLDLRNDRVNTLDNDARVYSRLTWNDAGTGLAVLKGVDVDKMRERDNELVVYPEVQSMLGDVEGTPIKLDPASAAGFPRGFVLSDRAALDWSGDNKRVFFGIKEQVAAPDTSARRRNADEYADVDVWNSRDERIQS
ncbi:MAG: hypothetical protein ACHQWU_11455, partial [Gemmatimonadales bacterium]